MYSGMDLMRGTNLNIGIGTDQLINFCLWLATGFFKEKLDMLDLPELGLRKLNISRRGLFIIKLFQSM